jgi:hypothetical protein
MSSRTGVSISIDLSDARMGYAKTAIETRYAAVSAADQVRSDGDGKAVPSPRKTFVSA